jgi:hypothetical protein
MNTDQPNDRTEDFLRKHLGDFSDAPPESVWNGISDRLPPPPPRRWTLHHTMGAVIAALVIALVAQFWYFEQRFERLQHELQTPAGAPSVPPVAPIAETPAANASNATPIAANPSTPTPPSSVFPPAAPGVQSAPPARGVRRPTTNSSDAPGPVAAAQRALPQRAAGTGAGPVVTSPAETPAPPTAAAVADAAAIAGLPTATHPLRARLSPDFPVPSRVALVPRYEALSPIRRYRMSPWNLTAIGMAVAVEQTVDVQPPPDPHPGGHGHHSQPKVVRDEGTQRATGWRAGVLASYALNRHWSIVGGLTWRQTTQESSFQPDFRIHDGQAHGGHGNPGHPGHHHQQYDFRYTGYGSGAEAEVTLRVESNSHGPSHFPPDRPIDLQITTRHEAARLELPLAVQYQLPAGRFRPFLRAGAIGGVFVRQSAAIERVELNDSDFTIHPYFRPRIKPSPLAKQTLSAWASGGTQFLLSRNLSLNAELWYARRIAGSSESTRPNGALTSVQESSLGVGLGLTYRL